MDEAVRCDRIALVQEGSILAIDAPQAIGARFPRPLFAVRGRQRVALLEALRAWPSFASAYPFGESVHFSDRRGELPPARIAEEVRSHLQGRGIEDVSVDLIDAGIEDAFMELMGVAAGVAA
jgi:hypothetical protein